jgi:Predicted glycosyl hydrolase
MVKSSVVMLIALSVVAVFIPVAGATGTTSPYGVVFGYYPTELMRSDLNPNFYTSYQPDWSILTHISVCAWRQNDDGTFQPADNMTYYYQIRDTAHAHGVKVLLSILTHDPTICDKVIANHSDDFVQNVTDLLNSTGADGIDLDWEEPSATNTITGTDNKPMFEAVVKKLHDRMKAQNSSYILTTALPPKLKYSPPFQNANLAQYFDYIFFMGYDYHHRIGGQTGANAPYSSSEYDVRQGVNDLLIYYPASKIVFGMPVYAYDCICNGSAPGATISNVVDNPHELSMINVLNNVGTYGRIWDNASNTPYYVYQVGKIKEHNIVWHQVWYDDNTSLKIKCEWAKSTGLAGVGYYCLGYETPDVWSILYSNVSAPVAAFTVSPTLGKSPVSMKFTDKSTNNPTFWQWNFGDKSTSTAQNPMHKYTKAGKYTVSLIVKNAAGSNTTIKPNYITVK